MDKNEIVDIEITVRLTIPRAVSHADLAEYYECSPLICAKELIETGGLYGATDPAFEILTAKVTGESH